VWRGTRRDEKGIDATSRKILIEIDPTYFRPTEVDLLIGDSTKACEKLGCGPTTTIDEPVSEMVGADFDLLNRERASK
jgi:GDPmannose 4,6-dehydratase